MNIWVVFIFKLLWIVLLWTLGYKYLFGYLFSILLGTYLRVELPGHMVILCCIYWSCDLLHVQIRPCHPPDHSLPLAPSVTENLIQTLPTASQAVSGGPTKLALLLFKLSCLFQPQDLCTYCFLFLEHPSPRLHMMSSFPLSGLSSNVSTCTTLPATLA